jgi:hypothetical protein
MRTFNEYYESKQLIEVDNWISNLAAMFLSKYGPPVPPTPGDHKPMRANTGVGGALHPFDRGYDAVDPEDQAQEDPNEELKKLTYQKIKDMLDDPTNPIRHPREIMANLRQDPEINSYLNAVSHQQRGAFTRNANVGFRSKADQWHNPLLPHPGMDPTASAHSMLSMAGGRV